MSIQRHLIIFKKINKILEIGIQIASFHATNQQFRHRLLIRAPLIATVLHFISTTNHIVNKFQGFITLNIAISLVIFLGCIQMFFKTFSMYYHRKSVLKIMNKIKLLHNNHENEKISCIAEESLTKFGNIWINCSRYI